MFRLFILNPPPGAPAFLDLEGEALRIGREADCDLILDRPTVSRRHATLHAEAGAWWIEDHGSGNGTFVNGIRTEKAWLKAGDRLCVGHVDLVFEALSPALSAPPPIPTAPPPPPPPPIYSQAQALPPPPPVPRTRPLPRKRKSTWGWWLGGSLGFLALAAVAGFALLQPSAPRFSAPVKSAPLAPAAAPPAMPQIQLPSGSSEDYPNAKLLPKPPEPLPAGAQALFTFQLGKEKRERLKDPVVLEFPYDPARLPAGTDPESQLALVHLDPDTGRWILAAAKVDTQRHVLRTRTRHLSTWSGIYLTMGWRIHRSRRFNVVFDPSETIVMQKIKGRAGLIDARDYAETLGRSLDIALSRYEAATFKAPEGDSEEDGRIWAFLGKATAYWGTPTDESQWSAFSGNLLFPSNYEDRRQADHDAAHELFHKIQNLDLNIKSMDLRRWWIEASADYAAARVALQQGGLDTTMGGAIKPRYLEKSITFHIKGDDGKQPQSFHDYATSHFIDYLVKQGADFKEMWDAVANPSWGDLGDAVDPLDKYLKAKFSASRGLDSFYRDFAQFYLFDGLSPMPKLKNGFYEDVASQKLSLSPGQRSGRLEASVEALHSAQVFAVRAEAEKDKPTRKIQVSLVPGTGTGIIASAFHLKAPGKGGLLKPTFLSMMGLKAATAELSPGELIVVIACNGTSSDRSIALEVKDLSQDIKKTAPPPPPASRGPRIEICVYAQVSYDRGFHSKDVDWSSRRWESFELMYNSGGIPISGASTLRGSRNDGRYEDTVEGSADGSMIRNLVWKAVRRYGYREERWEIELKDIPREPDLNQRGDNGTTYMIRVVDNDGKKFPNVAAHADIRKYEIIFPPDNTKVTLTGVNWYGTTIGNPNPIFSDSPMNQRPFIYVQVWK